METFTLTPTLKNLLIHKSPYLLLSPDDVISHRAYGEGQLSHILSNRYFLSLQKKKTTVFQGTKAEQLLSYVCR